jgi:hypothetical protein
MAHGSGTADPVNEREHAMARKIITIASTLLVLPLAACYTMPTGPSALVLPGTGKSFDQFRADDNYCRQFASTQLGGETASSAAVNSGVSTAAVGTLLGAAAGAAINGSSGAGVGAGTGLALGGLVGANTANVSGYGMQRRYDNSYLQCMYASGHRIPVSGHFSAGLHQPQQSYQQSHVPPPPPGSPPPPPPGYQ